MTYRFAASIVWLLIWPESSATFGQITQYATPAELVVRVEDEVNRSLQLSDADLAALPSQTVTAKDRDDKIATFEGVALIDILRSAGVKFGEELRGDNLALFLVVGAADGYRAVFALPELDPAFTDQVIILANRRNGAAITDKEQKWRVVVPKEKRRSRWVRGVTTLTVRSAKRSVKQ